MSGLLYISESRVRELLKWNRTFEATETAMESVANGRGFQTARVRQQIANTPNFLFSMQGYLNDSKYGALCCKTFTIFPKNVESIKAIISMFDEQNGSLKAIIAGNQVTEWRTAAASVIATKYLRPANSGKEIKILAVLGAGREGRIHAIAMQEYFKFEQVRIWNRTVERAKNLAIELNRGRDRNVFVVSDNVEECVKNADVVVTATTGTQVLVKFDWLKKGAHINAIAVNPDGLELDDATYKRSSVYVDCMSGARSELAHIRSLGVEFKGQIGDLVGNKPAPSTETTTIFQSLGMAVEDCAMARLIYDLHTENTA